MAWIEGDISLSWAPGPGRAAVWTALPGPAVTATEFQGYVRWITTGYGRGHMAVEHCKASVNTF